MDPDPNVSVVQSRNEELVQENTVLKSLLVEWLTGRQPSSLWQNSFNEQQVQRDFQHCRLNHEQRTSSPVTFQHCKLNHKQQTSSPVKLQHCRLNHKQQTSSSVNFQHCRLNHKQQTSSPVSFQHHRLSHNQQTLSPVDFKSFVQNSVHTCESDDRAESQCCQADSPAEVTGPDRLLGEIAFQLDRRILSYVFQGHKRMYGFTLLNVPQKILEVSTHLLTGKVDEGYRLHLTQRHAELMQRLNQLGYKAALHPQFSEVIVNTFGILKERPGENSCQVVDYNDSEFLRRLIEAKAPRKLRRNLLVLLSCLCSLAEKDRKPLLLW